MICAGCGHDGGNARFCSQCGLALAQPGDAAQEGERRQLTVLFCDMVDSTALAGRMDVEDWRQLLRAYEQAVTPAIERHGGCVAQYQGDGAVAFFGYPRAQEHDPERAIRAGLDIVEAVRRANATLDADRQIAVRVGVHTGVVVVTPGSVGGRTDVFGRPAHVASRLQNVAARDTVVISQATHALVPGLFVVEELGPQQLRGIPEPVACYRVVQASGVRSRLEIAAGRLSPFVGREPELATLRDRWARVAGGEGQNVLVVGEAGVGKSRLVYELRDHLAGERHTWLECHATPHTTGTPFFPVVELLERGLGFTPVDTQAERLEKLRRGLDRQGIALDEALPLVGSLLGLPVDPGATAEMSAELRRQRVLTILAAWNLALAEVQPLVLLAEDLHWFDWSSLQLLSRLIEQSPTAPVLLVGTARPEFSAPWPGRSNLTTLSVVPLTTPQSRDLVVSLSRATLSPDTVETLVARSGGIPLHIEELTKSVLEPGAEPGVEAIPATLADSLMGRLDQLAGAKEVAQRAAVLGREFAYPLLAATCDVDDAALREALGRLVDEEILFVRGEPPEARYTFKHALVQETAYGSLLKRSRRLHHERVATALESGAAGIGEAPSETIAHHFTEAGLAERAIPHWLRAGQRSTAESAPVEAIRSLERGLECVAALPEGHDRQLIELSLRALLGANLLAVRGYTAPEVSENITRALGLLPGLQDSPQLRVIVHGVWLHHLVLADRDAAPYLTRQFRAFAEESQDEDALCRAAVMDTIMAYWGGDFSGARRHAADARARYRPEMNSVIALYGDGPGPYGEIYEAMALWFQGQPTRARVHMARGRTMAREVNFAFTIAASLSFATQLEQLSGDAAATEALAEETIAYCEQQGFPHYLAAAMAHRGWARVMQGRTAEGLEDLADGVTLYRGTGAVLNVSYLLALLAEAYLVVGDRASGLMMVEEGLALTSRHLDRYFEAELHRLHGLLLALEPAAPEAAEAALGRALALAKSGAANALVLRALVSLARFLADRGRAEEARRLLHDELRGDASAAEGPDLRAAEAALAALG
jgi:class 3 adenylate cyclase/tetratricopeptide (TPR) repeat protein